MEPLISCICLTIAARTDFLKIAVDCFNRQTYPNRELVIVADPDCNEEAIGALAPMATIVMCSENFTIGRKRNIACEHSQGDYVAVWDDDDYSGPRRLTVQSEAIQRSQKAVTAFSQLPFVNEKGEWYMLLPHGLSAKVGTGNSLFFRRDWWETNQFEDIMIGEDAVFAKQALSERQIQAVKQTANFSMYGTNHSGNTSDRTFPGPSWVRLKGFEWSD